MITKEDCNKIWNEVKENSAKLKACPLHKFIRIEGRHRLDLKFRCEHCGGVIDGIAHFWYTRGVEDGKKGATP